MEHEELIQIKQPCKACGRNVDIIIPDWTILEKKVEGLEKSFQSGLVNYRGQQVIIEKYRTALEEIRDDEDLNTTFLLRNHATEALREK